MSFFKQAGRLSGLALACAALAGAGPAVAASPAEGFPNKPITLVVPFPPGGVIDLVGRALGEGLSKNLGQSIIVENKPGAGTTLGAAYVARARPDGYTLLMGVVHQTIASSVYKKLPYDFQKDLAPVSTVGSVGNAVTINSAITPVKSVKELVELAGRSPDSLAYGSNGNGTLQHLMGTLFQMQTSTKLLHVPYSGSAPLTLALLAGQVNLSFDSVPPVIEHVRSGKLTSLAVFGRARNPMLPDVPTLGELGYPGFEFDTWSGVMAPGGTPKEIVDKLSEEVRKVVASPAFVQRMTEAGLVTLGSTPEAFREKIAEETARFSAIAKEGNVYIE